MNADVVNSFIDAVLNTLETSASTTAEMGKPYVAQDRRASGPVSGVLSVSGDAEAVVSITFSESGILSVVSRLFGETIDQLNDEIKDAVGEISNMVSGQVTNTLAQAGGKYKVSLNTVILEEGHTIPHFDQMRPIALPFKTDDGEFFIEFSFEKT